MATNYDKFFGTPERAAKALSTVTTEDGIYVKRNSDDEPMNESKWLKWLQEECDE